MGAGPSLRYWPTQKALDALAAARGLGGVVMTAAVAPAIVCPPWCVEHWASDVHLGNPDGTFTHDSAARTFRDVEGGQLKVHLTQLLTADGRTAGEGPLVMLGDRLVTVAAAQGLLEWLTGLVEQVGAES